MDDLGGAQPFYRYLNKDQFESKYKLTSLNKGSHQ